MTAQTRTVLKSYFLRGLRPTQTQYGDLIDSFELVGSAGTFLQLTGGAMTGSLQLRGVPVSALEAATKGYVDAIVSAGGAMAGGLNGQIQYNNAGGFGGFSVSGDATLATTGVLTLASTAVSAGTYVTATVTVDAKGRITSASTGASGTTVATVKSQSFSASGTYTPSAGMLYCIVEVVGGGGSGGGSYGGGGGAGGYACSLLTAADIGASKTVTIGAGGPAVGLVTTGNAGGTSSLGALVAALGGQGGPGSAMVGWYGGVGGVGSVGQITAAGDDGQIRGTVAGTTASSSGGNSFFGAGGARIIAGGTANPGVRGSGGGGSANIGNSGAGGDGYIYITEFCSQ